MRETQIGVFSNCLQRNHPCFSHSSSAFATMPVPLPAFGVTITDAEHPHDLAALHRERLSHADDAVVSSLSADHGNRDAGVAGGGLDDGIAGLEQTLLLGVGDDCKRESVRRLKGTRRVVSVSGGTKISLRELLPAIGQLGLPMGGNDARFEATVSERKTICKTLTDPSQSCRG